MLQLFNSLTRQREPLKTLEPGQVRLYVCGITVYDYCHLGHARFLVVFDMFVRYLRAQGWQVRYVRNITDIDDKIIRRAAESGSTPEAVAERFADALAEDEAALGLIAPDMEPRATAHVGQIIAMIERLIERGAAYVGDNGDVYYDVSTFERYGALSGRRLDEMRSGARIAVNEAKDDPLDFVLWKAAKPGEPSWESPWGAGRPGWHIECSAMSTHCLGDSFDIHGGGLDLQFPHHENEIAQSEAATGKRYVGLWMHNGFVTVDDEKMSKSLGNFLTLRDVLAQYDAESVRYFVLATHYRSPLAYNAEAMDSAASALARLYTTLRDAPAGGDAHADVNAAYRSRFLEAMDDDLNTPAAIAVLFDMAREANRAGADESTRRADLAAGLREFGAMIGLLQQDADAYLQAGGVTDDGLTAETIEGMLAQRREARAARDFATADRIRDELTAAGVVLEDSAEGTKWRRG
ncbi:cysteine--tRNA ligase [Salinisphaera hydrothermalis]|uniref:Cysteine--tRNA ligase n=1 Tax=Salinisphaera hydrothermalis (strain C41B8) TaxID=1304275 RepID=A0A084IMG1_SALHC|nr:cysteine--tRNA ligase [Salinisphaera hydrothermalis]KEZ77895.1 cysteinyl-tRNA ligase [Salinisphaera hydrothermalis C41B8]